MKRKLLLSILFIIILSILMTVSVGAEEFGIDEGMMYDGFDYLDSGVAQTILIVMCCILGIGLAIVPLAISLSKLFIKKVKEPVPYYISFVASALWLALGIVILILLII